MMCAQSCYRIACKSAFYESNTGLCLMNYDTVTETDCSATERVTSVGQEMFELRCVSCGEIASVEELPNTSF